MSLTRILIATAVVAIAAAPRNETSPKPAPLVVTHPTGNSRARITGFGGRPFGLEVTTTGDVFVTEQDLNQAVHADFMAASGVSIPVGHDPGDVRATSDGSTAFITGFNDGTISVVNLETNRVTKVIQVSTSNAYRLAISPSESDLYVTSSDGHLYDVNTALRTVTRSVPMSGSQGLAIDHAGTTLYISSTSGKLWRLNLPSLTTATSVTQDCVAQEVAVSMNDAELYVACEDGEVLVLDPVTLARRATIPVPNQAPFGMAVSPDDQQIYVACAATGQVAVIDRATRTVINQLAVGGTPRRVKFNKSGSKAYISNEGNWVDVIE